MSKRYDVPKAAPEPLRQVQRLINSVDLVHGIEWLPDWLREHGLDGEQARALEIREALRALALANNRAQPAAGALETLNRAAARMSLQLDERGTLQLLSDGDALDEVVAVAFRAMLDGSWTRVKACRNCRWCFFDYSPNRSATWCSMQLCGNRTKTRAYRSRHRG